MDVFDNSQYSEEYLFPLEEASQMSYLKYRVYHDPGGDEVVITGYAGAPDILVVPETIELGIPVTSILDGKEHCQGAFALCYSLKKVVLPPNFKRIGDYAFEFCDHLKEIEFPAARSWKDNKLVDSENLSIGEWAFSCCCSLRELKVNSDRVQIESSAFANCHSLKKIEINSEIDTITSGSFQSCHSIKKWKCPETVITFEDNVFSGSERLEVIEFNEGLRSIGGYACMPCPALKKAILPASVEAIGAGAFPPETVLVVPEGSYAHAWAMEYGFKIELR